MSEAFERELEIFEAVCDVPIEQREQRLTQLCGGDDELRDRIRALLDADDTPERGLDGSALDLVETSTATTPTVIPGYRIVRKIGEGGMGVVYEAEQENPQRRVALKLIRGAYLDAATLLRFDQEARVLGLLNHRGIAQIFEAGHAGEQPFLVMELVDGTPLNRFAEERELSVEDRLELIARTCDALQHAHQKGVIHRDLKPSNILVDTSGQPKILDFGIARVTESDVTIATRLTSAGDVLGTLPYMSPEQLLTDSELDLRSDVYSMGVIAFQLLAGRLPLDVRGKNLPEAARIIAEEDPPTLGTQDARLRGDVETIVAKATDKERGRRYASAEEFARDIRRFLADEPITARKATTLYQLRKFARRNRLLVAAVAVVFVSLVAGTVTSTILYFEKEDERVAAEDAKNVAQERLIETQRARANVESLLDIAEHAAEREMWLRANAEDAADRERGLREISDRALVIQQELFDGFTGILRAPSSWANGSDVKVVDLLETSRDRIEERFAEKPAARATLLNAIGRTYDDLNMEVEALDCQRRAYAAAREHEGYTRAELATFEADLGSALIAAGELEEGKRVSFAALDILTAEGPDDLKAVQPVKVRLARMMRMLGRYNEALEHASAAVDIGRDLQGEDVDYLRAPLVALAELYVEMGRYDEAMEQCDEVFALRPLSSGQEDEHATRVLNVQAVVFAGRRQVDRAIEALERGIAGMQRLGGGESGNFAIQTNSLATLLAQRGRFDEAYPLLEESYELGVRLWGEKDFRIANMLGNWAGVLVADGRIEESLERVRACTDILRTRLGPQHIHYGSRMSGMAQTLAKLGRNEEAREAFAVAIPILRDFSAEGHPELFDALLGLAQLDLMVGQVDDARDGFDQARALIERKLGSENGLAMAARDGLAMCDLVAGNAQLAADALERVHADAQASSKPAAWLRARIRADRGLCLMATGEVDEGSREYEAGLAGLIERKGEGFPWVLFLCREAERLSGSDD